MKHPGPALRSDLRFLLRAALVIGAVLAVSCTVVVVAMWEVRHYHDVLENGPLELAQLALLALSSAALAFRAVREPESRKPLLLLALTALAMCVRELDGFFDVALFHGSWALLDAFVLLAFLAVAFRGFGRTVSQLAEFVTSPTFILFATGFTLAAVISRLLGMKENWYAFFDFVPGDGTDALNPFTGNSIRRCVKNAVEESFELGSYLVILAGAVVPPLLRRSSAGSVRR